MGGTGGGRGGASGWVWAVGGAIAASAVWASVMFATGAFSSEPRADLAGYTYTDDLCAATSLTPVKDAGFAVEERHSAGSDGRTANPEHSGSRQTAMDSMWCNASFKRKDASVGDYSSAWLYSTATLHKKSDPGPEFAAGYLAYEKQGSSVEYRVERVTGLGDDAYLVSQKNKDGGSGSSYVILGVRDGWMTYQSTWSNFPSSSASGKQPTGDDVATMLKTSARETLQRLRGSGAR
ncbi:hypothetical protein SNA_06915 [Streptomyces natalensis ATCC 27448]|uniref:Uncharacterized protein n=2 Tax=Streptomyces natalensis TaxID=68242 RepID=A0A0D7CQ71_9ACTN|nr:hypothetical protein SNA_06915 [Streptomyces natalensis ATCC 27448]